MRHNQLNELNKDVTLSILKEKSDQMPQAICRKYNINHITYYKLKAKYGVFGESDLKNIKQLENENYRLARMYIQACLEQKILQDAISGDL